MRSKTQLRKSHGLGFEVHCGAQALAALVLVVLLMAGIISLALVQTRSSYSGDWDEAAHGSVSPFDTPLRVGSLTPYGGAEGGAAAGGALGGGSASYGAATASRFDSFSDQGAAGAALRGGAGSATGARADADGGAGSSSGDASDRQANGEVPSSALPTGHAGGGSGSSGDEASETLHTDSSEELMCAPCCVPEIGLRAARGPDAAAVAALSDGSHHNHFGVPV
jgi:hypothetical protein